jgi:hypothetical protein
LRRELRGHRLAVLRAAVTEHLAVVGDVRDALGCTSADLHDVHRRAAVAELLGLRHRSAFEILAVGDEHHETPVVLALRVAAQELARLIEGARDRRSSDGHVVGLELSEELRDRRAVGRHRETHRLTGERDRAEARARQAAHELGHLGLRPLDA